MSGLARPGIGSEDITPLLADPEAFGVVVDRLAEHLLGAKVDKVVGVEARGFVLAARGRLAPRRRVRPRPQGGQAPWTTTFGCELEYGIDRLEIHRDAIAPGERVTIIDDVLATGGTAAATARLVESLGGEVVHLGFLLGERSSPARPASRAARTCRSSPTTDRRMAPRLSPCPPRWTTAIQASTCTACRLSEGRTQVVFGMGDRKQFQSFANKVHRQSHPARG